MSELICNELSKSYQNFQLSPTSFQLESGYLTVLSGKNGSGKSTLLRCLSGVDWSYVKKKYKLNVTNFLCS